MFKKFFNKKIILLIVLFSISVYLNKLGAQEKVNHLVINEIFLNMKNTNESWIEIYNPTDKVKKLRSLFISNIRTPNILPLWLKTQGGLNIRPEEFIIICKDKEKFQKKWNVPTGIDIIECMSLGFQDNHVFEIGEDDNGKIKNVDDIRIGIARISSSECKGDLSNKSNGIFMYSRKIDGFDSDNCFNDFNQTIYPTPGKSNK